MGAEPKLQDSDHRALLIEVVNAINQLNEKLDTIIEFDAKILKANEKLLEKISNETGSNEESTLTADTLSLLSLPLALRKTAVVLYRLERATADDLAKETGRLRAVESAAANELVRMGYVKKKREGRDVYFYISAPEEDKD